MQGLINDDAFKEVYNYLTKNKIFPSEIDFFDKQIYRTQCRLYTHVTTVIDSNGNLYCCKKTLQIDFKGEGGII